MGFRLRQNALAEMANELWLRDGKGGTRKGTLNTGEGEKD